MDTITQPQDVVEVTDRARGQRSPTEDCRD